MKTAAHQSFSHLLPVWLWSATVALSVVSCHTTTIPGDGPVSADSKSVAVAPRTKSDDAAAAVTVAKELVPGLNVDEIERETEIGGISWSIEGTVKGREITVEIDQQELLKNPPTPLRSTK